MLPSIIFSHEKNSFFAPIFTQKRTVIFLLVHSFFYYAAQPSFQHQHCYQLNTIFKLPFIGSIPLCEEQEVLLKYSPICFVPEPSETGTEQQLRSLKAGGEPCHSLLVSAPSGILLECVA